MINIKIQELSNEIAEKSSYESEFHPIDRYFLEKYMNQILSVDTKEFVLYNFELINPLYSVHLMLCLPEIWEVLTVDDIMDIINGFTNEFSFYAIIEFTYKFVEIDIIDLIFKLDSINKEVKENLKNYLINSFYPNLLKNETDIFFLEKGMYGIKYDKWLYIKQVLLLDSRVKATLLFKEEILVYIQNIKWN